MKKLKKAEMVRRGQVLTFMPQQIVLLLFAGMACFLSSHLAPCQIDHVRAERDVLAEVHNPYVVKLYYSFQVCSSVNLETWT